MSDKKEETITIKKPKIPTHKWAIATYVFALIAIVLILLIATGKIGGAVSGTISKDKILPMINNFANTQLVPSGGVNITSLDEKSGVYVAMITANNQNVPIYFTKDGYFISPGQNLIPINGGNTNPTPSTGKITLPTIDANTPLLGDKNAPVTVYEFSDFSCPFCAAASGDNPQMNAYMQQSSPSWKPIVTNLINDYVNTGKVKFVMFYSFGHSGGHAAQSVAWCLNDQGLYWKFYPKAFAAFDSTKTTQDVEDLDKMKTLAQSIGADMNKLNDCLTSKKYDSRFNTEQADASAAGLQGTPYFVLANSAGKTDSVSGAVPYSQFKSQLDAISQ